MNEAIRAIYERSSTRGYLPTPLTEEELKVLEDAALASPTARNMQEWEFRFVGPDIIDKVEEAFIRRTCGKEGAEADKAVADRKGKVLYGAPLMIVISADKDFKWSKLDSGIAVENIALAAEALGLGSVIIGCYDILFEGETKKEMEELLEFSENQEFAVAICIGHKAVTKEPHTFDRSKIKRLF